MTRAAAAAAQHWRAAQTGYLAGTEGANGWRRRLPGAWPTCTPSQASAWTCSFALRSQHCLRMHGAHHCTSACLHHLASSSWNVLRSSHTCPLYMPHVACHFSDQHGHAGTAAPTSCRCSGASGRQIVQCAAYRRWICQAGGCWLCARPDQHLPLRPTASGWHLGMVSRHLPAVGWLGTSLACCLQYTCVLSSRGLKPKGYKAKGYCPPCSSVGASCQLAPAAGQSKMTRLACLQGCARDPLWRPAVHCRSGHLLLWSGAVGECQLQFSTL